MPYYSAIESIARRVTFCRPEFFEDVKNEMCLAFLENISDDSPALALHKARCRTLDALRSRRYCDSHNNAFSHIFIGDWRVFERYLDSVEGFEDEIATSIDSEYLMSLLSAEERELVRLRFWDGMTQEQIARIYRVSRETISYRLRGICKKARESCRY